VKNRKRYGGTLEVKVGKVVPADTTGGRGFTPAKELLVPTE